MNEMGSRDDDQISGLPYLHELLEQQASISPDLVAVSSQDATMTYAELSQRSDKLAVYLQSMGVSFEDRVGILLERSCDAIIAIVAVLKCGACFVPLDPGLPWERLALILEESGTIVVVTSEEFFTRVRGSASRALLIDALDDSVFSSLGDHPQACGFASGLAYVIYTSGSTGRPKGVMIPHQGVVNLLLWAKKYFHLEPSDIFLHMQSMAFDFAVWEIFLAFASGGRLVIARQNGALDLSYIAGLLEKERVTTLSLTPSLLGVFLEDPAFESSFGLKRVFVGGEALPGELLTRFYNRWGRDIELINVYGPTEASIAASFWRCHPGDTGDVIPIGFPIEGVELHLVDSQLNPLLDGGVGEIIIGGVGVARGYLGSPALTAARFLPRHLPPQYEHPGERVYRTGDLGRQNSVGAIEYLGRLDQQVKIRGFRIELAEIEAALARHPSVLAGVAVIREDASGDKRLAAYVVAAEGDSIDPSELRLHVSSSLPDYMVPSVFVLLDSLPLTPSGKVDRRALPSPELPKAESGYSGALPESPLEEAIAQIWREILGTERVGVDEDFFSLGGHSLLAARLVSRLRSIFHVELSIRNFFSDPTVRGLARRLQGSISEKESLRSPLMISASAMDRRLAEAHRNRDLLEAIIEGDWLGLRLLSLLRESTGLSVSEVSQLAGHDIDEVAARMATLLACEAVSLMGQKFFCTRYGYEVVQKIEFASGINLGPVGVAKERPWVSQNQSDGT